MPYILVVDDDASDRWVMRELLDLEGYEVEEAASGQEAIDKVAQRLPDLVLLDILMPGIDGWRFLDELRRRQLRDRTRVIIVSGVTDTETVGRGRREGDGHIGKPFEPEVLLEAVRHALSCSPEGLLARRTRVGELGVLLRTLDALDG